MTLKLHNLFCKQVIELSYLTEERLEIQAVADDVGSKYVPPHVNIFCCLGGITFTCFVIQVATGFAVTFYYRRIVTRVFASVQHIMNDVNFGWLIRNIYRWSANMMALMIILHVRRVDLIGGFKKPLELTGPRVVLASLTVFFLVLLVILYRAIKLVIGQLRL